MIKYACDKCGVELGKMTVRVVYSQSKNKMVELCDRCLRVHEKMIRKADSEFWEADDEPTTNG